MGQEGEAGQALLSARAGLAARDAVLAAADRALTDTLAAAYAAAVESIARIEAIRADIDAAAGRSPDSPAGAHDLSSLLVAKQREIAAVLGDARAESEAKTAVLQKIAAQYRSASTG